MPFEIPAVLGPEGMIILGGILLVSLALSGFRFAGAFAGIGGGRTYDAGSEGKHLPVRAQDAAQAKASVRRAKRSAKRAERPTKSRGLMQLGRFAADVVAGVRSEQALESRKLAVKKANASLLLGAGRAETGLAAATHGDIAKAAEAKTLEHDDQWERVNAIIREDIDRAHQAAAFHSAAERQLDAVDYAYERMLVELTAVLPGVAATRKDWRDQREEVTAAALDRETDGLVSALRQSGASLAKSSWETEKPKLRHANA